MEAKPARVIKIFYCYAHEDRMLRDELEKHLSPLKRLGRITEWHDRAIQAGMEWEREIATYLNSADIILLLVSPDFIHSDYSYGVEMQQALQRHERREAYVIPIILRPVDWDETPISKLQVLPPDRTPITRWLDRDQAFLEVAKGIRIVVAFLSTQSNREPEKWNVIASMLPNRREQRLAYLLYWCNLKPKEIVRLMPEEFNTVQEIERLNRHILSQSGYNEQTLRWFLS